MLAHAEVVDSVRARSSRSANIDAVPNNGFGGHFSGGVLMRRYAFLVCILTLAANTVVGDVLSQFLLSGSQCPADVSIDANGRIATLVIDQNVAGLLLFNPDL